MTEFSRRFLQVEEILKTDNIFFRFFEGFVGFSAFAVYIMGHQVS